MLKGRFDQVLKAADGPAVVRAQEQLLGTEDLLADLEIWPFDEGAASTFDRIRKAKASRSIGRNDLLIASIALAHRATLVTRNLRHFRAISGLKLENWVD